MGEWLTVINCARPGADLDFHSAVLMWRNRPHLINRRLCGTDDLFYCDSLQDFHSHVRGDEFEMDGSDLLKLLHDAQFVGEKNAGEFRGHIIVRSLIPRSAHFCEKLEAVVETQADDFHQLIFYSFANDERPVRKRRTSHDESANEDGDAKPSPTADCTYRIFWSQNQNSESKFGIDVWSVPSDCRSTSPKSVDWLRTHLFPKLLSWAEHRPSTTPNTQSSESKVSLRLISAKNYARVHQRLKAKYYADIVKNWTESTDPQKFVSEDFGLASYILSLWEMERAATGCGLQSFVDLGCGNGLLVYLLRKEGHHGIGLDVRSRKTWSQFGQDGSLVERTFDPATETLPEFDWLIGNHSDELTPWIPWVAARSSYSTRFFLLPCCAFDFNRKFQKPGNESEYTSYFKYIRQVCHQVGFDAEEDVLRIPSTKRRCFVGRSRNYSVEKAAESEGSRQLFLRSRLEDGKSSFVVRSAVEINRNCSDFQQSLKDEIIRRIVDRLLIEDNTVVLSDGRKWNRGRVVSLPDLAQELGQATLDEMKNQCGGLQTFIRNHQFIFDIVGGMVNIRNYLEPCKLRKNGRLTSVNLKEKPCWFFGHHPDGCVFAEENCVYKHEKT